MPITTRIHSIHRLVTIDTFVREIPGEMGRMIIPYQGCPRLYPLFFALFLPQSGLNLASDNILIGEPDMDVCDLSVPPHDHQIGYGLGSV
jgi:hypothetical protein